MGLLFRSVEPQVEWLAAAEILLFPLPNCPSSAWSLPQSSWDHRYLTCSGRACGICWCMWRVYNHMHQWLWSAGSAPVALMGAWLLFHHYRDHNTHPQRPWIGLGYKESLPLAPLPKKVPDSLEGYCFKSKEKHKVVFLFFIVHNKILP